MNRHLIPAQLHLSSDGQVSKLGTYRFLSLPKVGERITIGDDPADVWLMVESITHIPVAQADDDWEGIVVLNCEIDG